MTKVKCDLTGCKYNSSCCSSPHDSVDTYCTKESITLVVDEDFCSMDCKEYEDEYCKEVECKTCQMKKYGGIKFPSKFNFKL